MVLKGVCVCEREREREKEGEGGREMGVYYIAYYYMLSYISIEYLWKRIQEVMNCLAASAPSLPAPPHTKLE
jgi:hypothetical protein